MNAETKLFANLTEPFLYICVQVYVQLLSIPIHPVPDSSFIYTSFHFLVCIP